MINLLPQQINTEEWTGYSTSIAIFGTAFGGPWYGKNFEKMLVYMK